MNELFLAPSPGKRDMTFSPTNTWGFFQIWATQREDKQQDAPYELGSLQMLPRALGDGTGSTAVLRPEGRTEQGVQQENKHGHAEEGRRAEGGARNEKMKCNLLISGDLGETRMDPGLRNICAW